MRLHIVEATQASGAKVYRVQNDAGKSVWMPQGTPVYAPMEYWWDLDYAEFVLRNLVEYYEEQAQSKIISTKSIQTVEVSA